MFITIEYILDVLGLQRWVYKIPFALSSCQYTSCWNYMVKPQFYIPAFCVFHTFTHFLCGTGQLPIRTVLPGFYTHPYFMPFLCGPHRNVISDFLMLLTSLFSIKLHTHICELDIFWGRSGRKNWYICARNNFKQTHQTACCVSCLKGGSSPRKRGYTISIHCPCRTTRYIIFIDIFMACKCSWMCNMVRCLGKLSFIIARFFVQVNTIHMNGLPWLSLKGSTMASWVIRMGKH